MADGRDLNEELMRLFVRRWTNLDQYFESVVPFPTGKEDRVVARFKSEHYPDEILTARVELRLRLNGDLNLQYIEEWPGKTWECRWDRHKNTHNAYEHFHRPPTVTPEAADDVTYQNPPHSVIDVTFEFVKDRVGDLWDGQLVYPNSYTFSWEYGPDIRP